MNGTQMEIEKPWDDQNEDDQRIDQRRVARLPLLFFNNQLIHMASTVHVLFPTGSGKQYIYLEPSNTNYSFSTHSIPTHKKVINRSRNNNVC